MFHLKSPGKVSTVFSESLQFVQETCSVDRV